MCVAVSMLPRMILRLLQHLRDSSIPAGAASPEDMLDSYRVTIEQADKFLTLLHEFCDMGTAMRSVITKCLVNVPSYQVNKGVYENKLNENNLKSCFLLWF